MRVSVCVCVCVCERAREKMCVCVCVHVSECAQGALGKIECAGPGQPTVIQQLPFMHIHTYIHTYKQDPLPQVAPGKIEYAGPGQPTVIQQLPFYDKDVKLEIDADKFKAMQKIGKTM
jgi:hypothetical protein